MRNAGDLRERVTLQRREVETVQGRSREAYTTIGTYPAEVLHASARDFYHGTGNWMEEKITIRLRALTSTRLAPGLRVQWQGRAFDVVEVLPDRPWRGFTELRAVNAEMEGSGC